MLPPQIISRLLPLRDDIASRFDSNNWLELATLTNSLDIIQNHDRLLRSLRFGDDDYKGCVLDVLTQILRRDPNYLGVIESYLARQFADCAPNVSSVATPNRIVFSPTVFTLPEQPQDPFLVAVMMPFSAEMTPVYGAIQQAARSKGLTCQRVDEMWQDTLIIQDVFSLIFRSNIVVCDFTGRNPNVFYECGIAHTLGKHVIPIAQHQSDIPFDLQHHRHLRYLNNVEGLTQLSSGLASRFATLTGQTEIGFRWDHSKKPKAQNRLTPEGPQR
jgi:hypothetical protein